MQRLLKSTANDEDGKAFNSSKTSTSSLVNNDYINQRKRVSGISSKTNKLVAQQDLKTAWHWPSSWPWLGLGASTISFSKTCELTGFRPFLFGEKLACSLAEAVAKIYGGRLLCWVHPKASFSWLIRLELHWERVVLQRLLWQLKDEKKFPFLGTTTIILLRRRLHPFLRHSVRSWTRNRMIVSMRAIGY